MPVPACMHIPAPAHIPTHVHILCAWMLVHVACPCVCAHPCTLTHGYCSLNTLPTPEGLKTAGIKLSLVLTSLPGITNKTFATALTLDDGPSH